MPLSSSKKLVALAAVVVVVAAATAGVCGSGRCRRRSRSSDESASSSAAAPTNNDIPSPTGTPINRILMTEDPTREPTLAPQDLAELTVAPQTRLPTLAPQTRPPTPAPQTTDPTLAPLTRSPTPAPQTRPPTPAPQTNQPTCRPTPQPVPAAPATVNLDGSAGALVTTDCTFRDYGYAIDILLSCGSERFNSDLRLHTFKRHSVSHRQVFNDQFLTVRNNGELWFTEYNTPRCVWLDNDGSLQLRTSTCSKFDFLPVNNNNNNSGYRLRDQTSLRCLTTSDCGDDRSTGGEECGGIDHRFLPLMLDDNCNDDSLVFRFETQAQSCSNEFPGNSCF